MPNTYSLISSTTLTTATPSVTFSAIPTSYTDLVFRIASRDSVDTAVTEIIMRINGETGFGSTLYSNTFLRANGSTVVSSRNSNTYSRSIISQSAEYTANVFSSLEIYIPSYLASQNKPMGMFGVTENNATAAFMIPNAMLYRNTAAINQISLTSVNNFVTNSSFYLYGISKS